MKTAGKQYAVLGYSSLLISTLTTWLLITSAIALPVTAASKEDVFKVLKQNQMHLFWLDLGMLLDVKPEALALLKHYEVKPEGALASVIEHTFKNSQTPVYEIIGALQVIDAKKATLAMALVEKGVRLNPLIYQRNYRFRTKKLKQSDAITLSDAYRILRKNVPDGWQLFGDFTDNHEILSESLHLWPDLTGLWFHALEAVRQQQGNYPTYTKVIEFLRQPDTGEKATRLADELSQRFKALETKTTSQKPTDIEEWRMASSLRTSA